jgi:hypothetical protein
MGHQGRRDRTEGGAVRERGGSDDVVEPIESTVHRPRTSRGTGIWGLEQGARETWTLISLDATGRPRRIWHQHQAGAAPTPLTAEVVDSMADRRAVGQAYACPECDELTVISQPPVRYE